MTSTDPSPSPEPTRETGLTGQILRARIKKMHLDSCDLDLLDDDDDDKVIAKGRLYQAESLAWKGTRLLKELPAYEEDAILDAVYLRRLRQEEGQALWYVHERWGKYNPWDDLELREEDIVTGTVVRSMVSTRDGEREQVGYLVQLDVGTPIRVSESGIIESSDRPQPDIEVFLPNRELPWADGSLDELPPNDRTERMSLEIGDPIQAMVREIRMPPNDPVVSLTRLIHHRDGSSEKTFKHRGNLAGWRFRRFLGKNKPENTSEEEAPEFTSGDKPYAGRRFLLVDDNPDTLIALSDRLSLMGAEVRTVPVSSGAFPRAVDDVTGALDETDFDLALIDNNLPGKDQGERLIKRVFARVEDKDKTRFALITADDLRVPGEDARAALRANGAIGFVQRPLSHAHLQRLLAGEAVWEEAKPHRANTIQPTGHLPTTKASMTPREILEMIAGQADIHFALLIRASRQIEAQDLLAAGHAPFAWDGFEKVLARTDLHLLIDRRKEQLDILSQEGGNEFLCVGLNGRSHWRILDFGGARWIFGVGHAAGVDIQAQLPLWSVALGTAVDAQGWRE